MKAKAKLKRFESGEEIGICSINNLPMKLKEAQSLSTLLPNLQEIYVSSREYIEIAFESSILNY